MLERIVGVNKAVVRVSSVLDFRKIETTEERYDPNGQVVRSEQRGQEKSSGVNGTSGGVPGVESNVPGGTEAEGGQTSSNNNQTKNETVNYEISRTVSRIVEPTGTIKKLSVAVLVDGTYEGGGKAGEAGADQPKKYVPRSEEEMKRIEEIVKKAMGYSTERQDQVEVVSIQFGLGAEEPTGGVEAAPDASKVWMPYVRYAVGGLLFFLIFFMVVRPLMVMLVQSAPAAGGGETPALPASVGQVEAAISGKQPGQILDMAKNNPANTAVVVKQWLKNNA
jgi:flagellar M-ring protein FliF